MSIKDYDKNKIIKRLKIGLPKAAFYLALFYFVFFLFGSKYVFVASVTATAFVFSYQKNFSCLKILMLAFNQILVCCLVCLASYHIALRLILNALFPFIWVFLHSSPFNNKGYFVGMFTFVFLQLIPIQFSDSPYLIMIVSIATGILALVLLLIKLLSKKRKPDFSLIQNGLQAVANLLKEDSDKTKVTNVEEIENALFKMAYDGNNFVHKKTDTKNIYYTFALVFQRATYFFSDEINTKENYSENIEQYRKELANFSEKVSERLSVKECESLIAEGIALLEKGNSLSGRFGSFYRNYIRLIILALKELKGKESKKKKPALSRYTIELLNHIELNAFEMRFALRLSLISFISFLLIYLLNSEHAYWIALNAFVITQPSYEDSITRTRARLGGSFIGCMMAYLAYYIFPNSIGLYAYFTITILCMYLSTPGKIIHAIFATACGVAVASITLGGGAAVEYRILYLFFAAVIVFVSNKFFFPSTQNKKFKFILKELYRMQKNYLTIMESILYKNASLSVLRNHLINFHMLRNEAANYITKNCNDYESQKYKELILTLWRMVAEAEQMAVIIQTEIHEEEDRKKISEFIKDGKSFLKKKKNIIISGHIKPSVTTSPIFNDLAQRYSNNLSEVKAKITAYVQSTDIKKVRYY